MALSSSTTPSSHALQVTHTFVPHHLTTPISLKLDDASFLIWRQQVLATIKGLIFFSFLRRLPCSSALSGFLG